MRRIRRLAVSAALAVAATVLTGCVAAAPAPAPATPAASASVAPDLATFYGQAVSWSSCGSSQDCATLTAPVDWNAPTGATIQLAITRHKATGTKLGSLLVNPGGPGGSGYDFVHDSLSYFLPAAVQAQYDVIGFDPRGVGRSTPVVCYTDTASRDQMIYGTYSAAYGSGAWATELAARQKQWVAACQQNTGPLLGHIDSTQVAHDMDMMRAVLGDAKLNYLGYSFGTYLGTMYANLFPGNVGKMVLDGAVKPPFGGFDELATQMAGFDSAFRAYMQSCLAAAGCPFSGTVDAASTAAHDLIVSVGAQQKTSGGRAVDAATIATGVSYTLYNKSNWSALTKMFAQLKTGGVSLALTLADAYNGRSASGYADRSLDVYFAATCAEGTIGTDTVSLQQGLQIMAQKAPIIGDLIAYDDYALLETACSQWPYPQPTLPTSFSAAGAPPIIVIGTSNDPATPYQNAVDLAKTLSSGVLISYQGEGHTIYGQGVACVDDAVNAYLLQGTVPATDPHC